MTNTHIEKLCAALERDGNETIRMTRALRGISKPDENPTALIAKQVIEVLVDGLEKAVRYGNNDTATVVRLWLDKANAIAGKLNETPAQGGE